MDIPLRIPTGTTPGPILLALTLGAVVNACATDAPAGDPTRETLPNGAVLVRYPGLPAIDSVGPEVTDAQVDLQFGSREGDDPNFLFGDIRGIQAASDGTMYVFNYQAVEIRAYGPDGEYLRTIARRGEGPGEIMEANGIFLSGDTLLWMHDYGQGRIIGVDPAGEEVRRFTKPIFSYGYIWDGTFDRHGRYWRQTESFDDGGEEIETGPYAGTRRTYYKSYDLSTEEVDSVNLGESTFRTYVSLRSGYQIPFDVSDIHVVSPSGGFWHANTGSYRLTQTDEGGDTLTVIEASLPGIPVTSEDRLWVERAVPTGTPPFYDLFSEDGDYLGSVRFAFQPGYRLWVRHGNIYTRVVDELGVQYVARAPVS